LVDYIPALEAGLTAGTVVDDALHVYDVGPGQPPYAPVNDDGRYYGLTTLTEALRRSVNTVAVQVLDRIGVQTGLRNGRRMGLPLTQADAHLSLAIGGTTDCCTPLDMASAYAAIANGGVRVTPRLVLRVVAPDGRVLVDNPERRRRVVDPRVAYVMTRMLETVDEPQPNHGWNVVQGPLDSNWGTGYDATVQDNVPGWPTAAKTGTTNSSVDAWYVGYTPKLAAAVWVGYDRPQPMDGAYGGTLAGPIFKQTLEAALAGERPTDFPRPAGVVRAPIDIKAPPWTVAMPGPLTPAADVRQEWFVDGTQPTRTSPLWQSCGNGGVFLARDAYSWAWAGRMAGLVGKPAWSLLPLDQTMLSPDQACWGSGAGPGSASGAASASASSSGAGG
jgi:penicillin-binding protein 1A